MFCSTCRLLWEIGLSVFVTCIFNYWKPLQSNCARKLFCCSSLRDNNQQYVVNIRLKAIVIDPRILTFFVLGGSNTYDIRSSRMHSVDRPFHTCSPGHMIKIHHIHFTGLFSFNMIFMSSLSMSLNYLWKRCISEVNILSEQRLLCSAMQRRTKLEHCDFLAMLKKLLMQ